MKDSSEMKIVSLNSKLKGKFLSLDSIEILNIDDLGKMENGDGDEYSLKRYIHNKNLKSHLHYAEFQFGNEKLPKFVSNKKIDAIKIIKISKPEENGNCTTYEEREKIKQGNERYIPIAGYIGFIDYNPSYLTVYIEDESLYKEAINKISLDEMMKDEYIKVLNLFKSLWKYKILKEDNEIAVSEKKEEFKKEMSSLKVKLKGENISFSNLRANTVIPEKGSTRKWSIGKNTGNYLIEYDQILPNNNLEELKKINNAISVVEVIKLVNSKEEVRNIKIGKVYDVSGKIDQVDINDFGLSVGQKRLVLYIK
ncbi:hypothetical protein CH380_19190 [Leptospira adleri]|nr:hypothetical protein CH380_19190 [Leptospira adleri]